jgi:solute carrier family 50 (sugar transporter)
LRPHQLPNVIGFSFGVVQMGLYALYRNATPRVPAKDVADDASKDKAPGEHVVVTIAKLTAATTAPAAAVAEDLVKVHDGHPEEAAKGAAKPAENGAGRSDAEQV